MGRRGYIDDEKKVVFFWAQKCACTTLFAALRLTYGENNKYFQTNSVNWFKCEAAIRDKGYASAIIVRDPIDRMISCYINKFVHHRARPLHKVEDLEGFSKKLLEHRNQIMDADPERNSMTFDEFLLTINHMMSRRVDHNNNGAVNGHWDTQIPLAALNLEYDHVVRMENFAPEFKALCDRFELNYHPDAKNKTEYKRAADGYLGAVPADELVGQDLDKQNFRSPESDRFLRYIYAIDYIKLGY